MPSSQKDYFAHKAQAYEKEDARVKNVRNIADMILHEITYSKTMHIADFGSGTGLLLEQIAPYVGKITAIDISSSMNETLLHKKEKLPCALEILPIDLSTQRPHESYDGIISSMTVHHVEDTKKLFETFYSMLYPGGSIAISDLDTEDGTFHREDTGVFHYGFDRKIFISLAQEAGFTDLKIQTASTVSKPYGKYGVFLLTGKKPSVV